jgi:hypothetical protein
MTEKSIPPSARGSHETLRTPSLKTQVQDNKVEEEHEYPSSGKLWLLMSSLYISMFLIALVRLPSSPHLLSMLLRRKVKLADTLQSPTATAAVLLLIVLKPTGLLGGSDMKYTSLTLAPRIKPSSQQPSPA